MGSWRVEAGKNVGGWRHEVKGKRFRLEAGKNDGSRRAQVGS